MSRSGTKIPQVLAETVYERGRRTLDQAIAVLRNNIPPFLPAVEMAHKVRRKMQRLAQRPSRFSKDMVRIAMWVLIANRIVRIVPGGLQYADETLFVDRSPIFTEDGAAAARRILFPERCNDRFEQSLS